METHRKTSPLKLFHLFVIVIALVGVALVYVWSHISITRYKYQIAKEMNEKERLEEEIEKLKVEIATLKAPQRIEKIAREKLHMIYPKREQVIFIK